LITVVSISSHSSHNINIWAKIIQLKVNSTVVQTPGCQKFHTVAYNIFTITIAVSLLYGTLLA
jgi:hypothetical protein